MNVFDDYGYMESTVYDNTEADTCQTVNKWLDDLGWV